MILKNTKRTGTVGKDRVGILTYIPLFGIPPITTKIRTVIRVKVRKKEGKKEKRKERTRTESRSLILAVCAFDYCAHTILLQREHDNRGKRYKAL